VAQAKEMDLFTYLQRFDPDELVHVAGNEYSTKTHDSLKISNGMWIWNSRGIAGRSALDYLVKVRGMGFLDAVETILRELPHAPSPARAGGITEPPPNQRFGGKRRSGEMSELLPSQRQNERYEAGDDVPPAFSLPKQLQLPPAAPDNDRVIAYLTGRGIDRGIVDYCVATGRLYEGLPYHSAVFVGVDKAGLPRYAALRGTKGSFKGEASGSDKRYSFSLPAEGNGILHLFESAVDALSFATLMKLQGQDWQREHLLSLAGVFAPAKNTSGRLPAALTRYLEDYPEVRHVDLHLDNDPAGRAATLNISILMDTKQSYRNQRPSQGKDVNDALRFKLGLAMPAPERRQGHEAIY